MDIWTLAKPKLQDARRMEREKYFKEEVLLADEPVPLPGTVHEKPHPEELPADEDRKSPKAQDRAVPNAPSGPDTNKAHVPLSAVLSPLTLGSTVKVVNLSGSKALNGRLAKYEEWHHETGRCVVRMEDGSEKGRLKSIKPSNLMPALAEWRKAARIMIPWLYQSSSPIEL
eukprot:5912961-Amphidinium_carterae.1